ncbi:MAG TPA: hypothetical protein VF103_06010, partial [Polyangiaceae bacterium]
MTQKVTAELELVAELAGGGEFDFETLLRELVDSRRRIGLWEARGKQCFDLAFGPARHGFEKFLVVLVRQVLAHELQGRKMDGARRKQAMNDWEAAAEARSGDAAEGFVFSQTEGAYAKLEHRAVACEEVKATVF